MDKEDVKELELHQLALEYVKLFDQRRSMLDAPGAAEFTCQYLAARKEIKETLKKSADALKKTTKADPPQEI